VLECLNRSGLSITDVGERDDHSDCRNTHKPPRRRISLRTLQKLPIEDKDLFPQALPDSKHWLGYGTQSRVIVANLSHPTGEQTTRSLANHMTEGLQQATQRVGRRLTLRDELRAGYQQQPQRLPIHAFNRNLAEPAGPHHLCQAMRIVGVGLIDLHAQGRLGVARIDANDGHPACTQGPRQEVRQQSSLKPSSHEMRCVLTDCPGQGIGIGDTLAPPYDHTLLVNHAD
jgi:hypothetical protein